MPDPLPTAPCVPPNSSAQIVVSKRDEDVTQIGSRCKPNLDMLPSSLPLTQVAGSSDPPAGRKSSRRQECRSRDEYNPAPHREAAEGQMPAHEASDAVWSRPHLSRQRPTKSRRSRSRTRAAFLTVRTRPKSPRSGGAGKRLFDWKGCFGGDHGVVEPGLVGNRSRRRFIPCRNRVNDDALARQAGDGGLTPCARAGISVWCEIRPIPIKISITQHPSPVIVTSIMLYAKFIEQNTNKTSSTLHFAKTV